MGLLSWLTGRRDGAETPAGAPSARAETQPPASAPSVPAWGELPPVQRALTAPGLLTDPVGFRGSLSAWQDTTFQKPLGHLVSPEAPSGLGHGLTSAFTVSRDAEEEPGVPEFASRSAHGSGATSPVPIQRTAVETSLASARPLQTSLRELPQLTVAPRPSATASASASSVDTSTSASAPVQRSVPPVTAAPTTAAATDEGPTDTLPSGVPRSRGLGLGEPLHSLPPTAQRAAAAHTPQPVAPLNQPTAKPSSQSLSSDAEDPGTTPRALLGDDPLTTVSRTDETSAETGESPASQGPAPAPAATYDPVPLQRAAEDGTPLPSLPTRSPEQVAPLVAQRSVQLFSGAEVPSETPTGYAPSAPLNDTPPAVPVRWSEPETHTTGSARTASPFVPAGGDAPSGVTPVQRTVTAQPEAPGAAAAHAPVVGPVTTPKPPVQRLAQRTPVSAPLREPRGSSAPPPDAGAVAVAAGVAQRMADGSVVFRSPTVQRDADSDAPATDTAAEPPPPPHVPDDPVDPPPEPEPEPEPVSDEGHGPAAQPGRPDAHGPPGSPGGPGGAPKVTDELVRALFAPLSRMLKAELRLDRERAGFLINTRH